MSPQNRLILIAPYWSLQVEQFIRITQDNFDVSVLTFKTENFRYQNAKVEILQCFETLSPWEIIKITPWILQHQPAVFHFFLNAPFKTSELLGLTSLVSLLSGIPHCELTYSLNAPLNTWGRFLLKPLLESSSQLTIWNPSTQLNPPNKEFSQFQSQSHSHANSHSSSKSQSQSQSHVLTQQNLKNSLTLSHKKFWLFPYSISHWTPLQTQILKTILLLKPDLQIAIPDWGDLPIRKRHLWRSDFLIYSNQIHIPFHFSWESINKSIESIIFAGSTYIPWNEMDLIRLAQNEITLFLDNEQVQNLEAPWYSGNQFWEIHKKHYREDFLKYFQTPEPQLHFNNINSLLEFQDYKSNQLLRAISEKGTN